jgi:hypothetical protein
MLKECNSLDRFCRIISNIERKPRMSGLRVLIVNEDLGL